MNTAKLLCNLVNDCWSKDCYNMYSFKYIFSLGSAEKLFESRFGIQIIRYFSLHPS